jgi:hypothetical protein
VVLASGGQSHAIYATYAIGAEWLLLSRIAFQGNALLAPTGVVSSVFDAIESL